MPIPIESTDLLRTIVAPAMNLPTQRQYRNCSPSLNPEDYGTRESDEGPSTELPPHDAFNVQGSSVQGLYDGEQSQPWENEASTYSQLQRDMLFADIASGHQQKVTVPGGSILLEDNDIKFEAHDEDLGSQANPTGTQQWNSEHENNEEDDQGEENQYDSFKI